MFRRDSQKWNELTVKVEYDMCITSGPSIQTQMTVKDERNRERVKNSRAEETGLSRIVTVSWEICTESSWAK
jgi:hypothetical protein